MGVKDILYWLFVPFDEAGVHLSALVVWITILAVFGWIDWWLFQILG